MTIKPTIRIADEKLVVKDRTILTNVPDNVIDTSGASAGLVEGVFLGAVFDHENSRHVVSLGMLLEVRFLACFRFKLWWMAQKMGDKGRDIPLETQFLLVETKDGSNLESDINGNEDNNVVYTVFLPLVEGPFKACLQGNDHDELELCLESGDIDTVGSTFAHSVYISSEVTQEGVEAGLESLTAGGTPPKFVIIDDGWQSVAGDYEKNEQQQQQQPLLRLTGIKENPKFQNKNDPTQGIKNIVNIAKHKHGLKYVYVWHAITGYWGGVRPGVKEMEDYGSKMQYPKLCKGVLENEPVWKTDAIAMQGLGLMNPKNVLKFYNELHSYLASAGVDGVKVDAQCILETLGAGLGGRVELTRQYHQALDTSVAGNFLDNGCISCMSHNLESLYCSKQTAIVRASDDFYPRDPVSHTIHIVAVAYNSVFLGDIMLTDWDMFHSLHPAAEYHGSARAISGGPVYVSLLKIWNINKYTGVLGVYNCQGAAWNSVERKNTFHQTKSESITGNIRGSDVHLISEVSPDSNWNGNVAMYSYRSRKLVTLQYNVAITVSLRVLEHEIFTISPVKVLAPGFSFAPLGLIDMFNAGGAIEELKYKFKACTKSDLNNGCEGYGTQVSGVGEDLITGDVAVVSMDVKGCGRFGAYSSTKPRKCTVGSSLVEFEYDSACGLVTLNLHDMPPEDLKVHNVEIEL
ncbi:putative galactinol--sucrose galactosyltransferase 6 [Abeliophyllum distichum]|uniref:galactinol--sucrose galactosyltransferase n=1 Tax=Abeliophyllum distichum TaxID=126358 RepID=A0ABD1PNQ5_9LAMI